ncbi:MAG: hypothetical protein HKN58_01190 [Xanthomonadales bacterium]|nr:hypothetical protein [Xanthomonadales bacterium]
MMRFSRVLTTPALAATILSACNPTVTVDPIAMPWEVAILNGACHSALQIRTGNAPRKVDQRYGVVRKMYCPDALNAGGVIELIQVRVADGTLYWFDESEVLR